MQRDRGNPRLKFLDRYVGIPIIVVLGVFRRLRGRRTVPGDWNTIGLLVTAGIGDAVLLTGILRDVRAARPAARIVVFVTANNAAFARMLAVPDEVVELPVRRLLLAVRDVRRQRCDVVVDFGAWRRYDAGLAALSGARATIGRRTSGQYRHFAYDVIVDHQSDHEVDNDRRLISSLGICSASPPALRAETRPDSSRSGTFAVLHLWPGGANCMERSWPIGCWTDLAMAFQGEALSVVLTGGPEDTTATEAIVAAWRGKGIDAVSVAGCSWTATISVLAEARCVVSVNTGVMHVAAALGAPVIALHGPTSVERWGPVGPHTRSVTSPMVPNGYLNLGFERSSRYRMCMEAITVGAVLAAWADLRSEVDAASLTT